MLLDRSMLDVIKHIAKDLEEDQITTSWPVESIEYGEGGAVVAGPGGASFKCAHVLVIHSILTPVPYQ